MSHIFTHAIVRKPGDDFFRGITTSNLGTPNYELILKQHENYINTLRSLGIEVIVLNSLKDYPDAYFVEDTAVITPDIAIITNLGAEDRKGEEDTIEQALARYRKTVHIRAPGTVEGGDVLLMDSHCFIGISERTNREGSKQLGCILEEYGYTWAQVYVEAGLHLKSSINYMTDLRHPADNAYRCWHGAFGAHGTLRLAGNVQVLGVGQPVGDQGR
ncbi:MAG: arginine deiminase family protein, partial [Desulfatiglandales bacterium]